MKSVIDTKNEVAVRFSTICRKMQRAFRRVAVALRQPLIRSSNSATTQISVITGSGFQTFRHSAFSMQARSFSDVSDKDFEPKRTLASDYDELERKLKDLVTNNKVVLFMKG